MCPDSRPTQGGWWLQAHLRNCPLGSGSFSAHSTPRMREWSWNSPKGREGSFYSVPPLPTPIHPLKEGASRFPQAQYPSLAIPQRRVSIGTLGLGASGHCPAPLHTAPNHTIHSTQSRNTPSSTQACKTQSCGHRSHHTASIP